MCPPTSPAHNTATRNCDDESVARELLPVRGSARRGGGGGGSAARLLRIKSSAAHLVELLNALVDLLEGPIYITCKRDRETDMLASPSLSAARTGAANGTLPMSQIETTNAFA